MHLLAILEAVLEDLAIILLLALIETMTTGARVDLFLYFLVMEVFYKKVITFAGSAGCYFG